MEGQLLDKSQTRYGVKDVEGQKLVSKERFYFLTKVYIRRQNQMGIIYKWIKQIKQYCKSQDLKISTTGN